MLVFVGSWVPEWVYADFEASWEPVAESTSVYPGLRQLGFPLAVTGAAGMFAASALGVPVGAGVATIVALALLYGIFHGNNANTVGTGTFLLGYVHH